jgi:tRNA A-37 threonylcarbamoyl transferase component Bud32
LQQRYRILDQVGKGGFSAVYKAEDMLTRQLVAIKAVSLRGLRAQEIIEATDAFHREVQILSDLKHPSLPHIYDHFSDAESWYIVMDFIQGTTLEKHLEKTRTALPLIEALEIGLVLCNILTYLHSRYPPIVFRDLKPANVILTEDGKIYLIDFGIARRFKQGQVKDTLPFGSPGYAAPEQYGRAQTSPRTDIYSLGVLLHQMLSGHDPTLTPFHFAALHTENPAIPPELEALVLRMVRTDSQERPESIETVRDTLQTVDRSHRLRHGLPALATVPQARNPVLVLPGSLQGNLSAAGALTFQSQQQAVRQQQVMVQQHAAMPPRVLANPTAYYQPPFPYAPVWTAKVYNSHAIASVILAVASLFLPFILIFLNVAFASSLWYTFGRTPGFLSGVLIFTTPIIAVILGHIGQSKANKIPALWGTKDTAVIGLIIGYIMVVLASFPACLYLATFSYYLR